MYIVYKKRKLRLYVMYSIGSTQVGLVSLIPQLPLLPHTTERYTILI